MCFVYFNCQLFGVENVLLCVCTRQSTKGLISQLGTLDAPLMHIILNSKWANDVAIRKMEECGCIVSNNKFQIGITIPNWLSNLLAWAVNSYDHWSRQHCYSSARAEIQTKKLSKIQLPLLVTTFLIHWCNEKLTFSAFTYQQSYMYVTMIS